jgi:hypothetical protein
MANTFKPNEQKRLEGNPGKRPLPTPVAEQPRVTIEQATASPLGVLESVLQHAQVWLGATDAIALALLHECLEERLALKAEVAEGNAPRWELRKLDAQILKLLADLGLNPTARSRIGLSEVQAASTLDAMRERQNRS